VRRASEIVDDDDDRVWCRPVLFSSFRVRCLASVNCRRPRVCPIAGPACIRDPRPRISFRSTVSHSPVTTFSFRDDWQRARAIAYSVDDDIFDRGTRASVLYIAQRRRQRGRQKKSLFLSHARRVSPAFGEMFSRNPRLPAYRVSSTCAPRVRETKRENTRRNDTRTSWPRNKGAWPTLSVSY